MTDYTLLVNALNPLPDAWQPEDMVDLYDLKARSFYLPLSPRGKCGSCDGLRMRQTTSSPPPTERASRARS